MGQGSASNRPALKTLVRVFRGDACAVYDAVRREACGGLVIPPGPYRYPFAAALELLKLAGMHGQLRTETTTDPILSADAFAQSLCELIGRGGVIGLGLAERLDRASAELFGRFIKTCRLLASRGVEVPRLLLGTASAPPVALQIQHAQINEVSGERPPLPAFSDHAMRVYDLMRSAPHPVGEDSLRQAAELPLADLRAALVELAAAKFIVAEDRVALGPASENHDEYAAVWLDTNETGLPHARLACARSREPDLARQLARAALLREEATVARACLEMAGLTNSAEFAQALAVDECCEAACAMLDELPAEPGALVAARLALHGGLDLDRADTLLRRQNDVETRAWRARLAMYEGRHTAALNLLQRTSNRQLEELRPDTRMMHLLTHAMCRIRLGDNGAARRVLREVKPFCLSGHSRSTWHELMVQSAEEETVVAVLKAALTHALSRLDASGAARFSGRLASQDVAQAWMRVMASKDNGEKLPSAPRSPEELFAWLRGHGATLLAHMTGDDILIHPVGAAMQPGLSAKLEGALRRLREYPSATLFRPAEFRCAGPFFGDVVLALPKLNGGGPAIVFLNDLQLSAEQALLATLSEGCENG